MQIRVTIVSKFVYELYTVVVLSVLYSCQCVCLSVHAYSSTTTRPMSDTNGFRTILEPEEQLGDFPEGKLFLFEEKK